MTKGDIIKTMLRNGKKYKEIANETGVAISTVAYHADRIGLKKFTFNRVEHDWTEIQKFYDDGHVITEILAKFNLCRSVLNDAKRRGDFVTNDSPERKLLLQQNRNNRKNGYESQEHLSSTGAVKRWIIRNNSIEYSCSNSKCNLFGIVNPQWNEENLALHLDHINGKRDDHRLENLRFLCPNCHSQTNTYCGRNKVGGDTENRTPMQCI